MPLTGKPLESISAEDVAALIGMPEPDRVEFKSEIGNSDDARRDYCGEITALANTAGGLLLVGVGEADGVARDVGLVPWKEIDIERLRLVSIAESLIKPRIPGLRVHLVKVGEDGGVIVLRVPKSFAGPHAVDIGGSTFRFFRRRSGGKIRLDIDEVGRAFRADEEAIDAVRAFRLERVTLIKATETPVLLSGRPKIVLHVVPLAGMERTRRLDAESLARAGDQLNPPGLAATRKRVNLDGIVRWQDGDRGAQGYVQLFRSGAIEAVDAFTLGSFDGRDIIPAGSMEVSFIEALDSYLDYIGGLEDLGPPVVVMLTLIDVHGLDLVPREKYDRLSRYPIAQDDLILPEEVVEELEGVTSAQVMRPILDVVWNAAGFDRCLHYDEEGVHWYTETT